MSAGGVGDGDGTDRRSSQAGWMEDGFSARFIEIGETSGVVVAAVSHAMHKDLPIRTVGRIEKGE